MSKPYNEMSIAERIDWNIEQAKREDRIAANSRRGYKGYATKCAKKYRARAEALKAQLAG